MTPPAAPSMPTLLLVDDDALNRKLARLILEHAGYRVLSTDTAEEGIAVARRLQPPLALLDVHLPGMSGVDAARALREDPATAGIKLIAVTASVMREDRAWIMGAGFDGFVAKPFRRDELLAEVAAVLNGRGPG